MKAIIILVIMQSVVGLAESHSSSKSKSGGWDDLIKKRQIADDSRKKRDDYNKKIEAVAKAAAEAAAAAKAKAEADAAAAKAKAEADAAAAAAAEYAKPENYVARKIGELIAWETPMTGPGKECITQRYQSIVNTPHLGGVPAAAAHLKYIETHYWPLKPGDRAQHAAIAGDARKTGGICPHAVSLGHPAWQ